MLTPWKESYDQPRQYIKKQRHYFSIKIGLVKAIVFHMYGGESWTIKKTERRRIDAFELWCWRRLLRIPWKARRSNQSIFKLLFIIIIFLLYNIVLVLPYINMNPPRVYTCSQSWNPLPLPSPYHLSGSSQCTSPKHPVPCIKPRLAIRFLHDSIHVSVPFSQIIPPSPSPTESKTLFYTFVSLLLSRIQGYHYHLSKFHIYVLVYCIGVFLSGLLHSV